MDDTIFIPDEMPLIDLRGLLPVVGLGARVLVLGSMPGTLSLQHQQYYAAPRNRFWPLMAAILDVELPVEYERRVSMLRDRQIGLWDVLAFCRRRGASDSSIQDAIPNDFSSFFAACPDIETVALNGTKAAGLFREMGGWAAAAGRRVLSLPSTSPANARVNLDALIKAWSPIRV